MVSSTDAVPRSVGEASAAVPATMITLVSMDGDSFEVEASAIELSQLIKAMIDGEMRSKCCTRQSRNAVSKRRSN